MARGNPNPKTEHLPPQKTTWNNLPTEIGRYPQVFKESISIYARALDGQCSPFEAIIPLLHKLSKDELEQIKLAIECLFSSENATQSLPQIPSVERSSLTLPQASLQVQPQLSPTAESEVAVYTANKASTELSLSQIEQLRSKYGFVPSKYQLGIIDWVVGEKGNGCCNAVAGSGKSTTLLMVAKALWEAGFKPYEIKVCVFGKDNSTHLIKKFGPLWKTSISTLHSAAFSLVRRELNAQRSEDIVISKQKYQRIAQSLNLIPKRGLKIGRLWA
ncbi:MAG: hypothetical protein ICV54_27145, partial [Nostoc sp. C3-bin3]|nr:hypothetical protein [Nostoc sp. C3-bin3]